MRLDLFLKASRLVLRRSVAQTLCDAGHVKINGLAARSAKEIKAGDTLVVDRRGRVLTVKVKQVPNTKQVSRIDAVELYEVISEEILPGSFLDGPFESE